MKQIHLISAYLLLSILLGLSSCSSSVAGGLVGATGRPGEVMLVMDNEYFNGSVGDQIVQLLEAPAPALPQDEPMLRLSHVETDAFESFLRLVRNVVIVKIDASQFTEARMKYSYNDWARGQMVVRLNAPSSEALARFLVKNGASFLNLILRHELYRYADLLKGSYSERASHLTDSLFNYKITVPRAIIHSKVGKDFLWMSNGQMRKRQDILVYSYPYQSVKDLELPRMIEVRDSVLKANIVGEFEGSYPITAKLPTEYRTVKFAGGPLRSQMRGLWEMHGGAMMGGPFVSQSFYDKQSGKVLVVEGFVYNPNNDKLNLIRTMEASLYTFQAKDKEFLVSSILKASFSKSSWSN